MNRPVRTALMTLWAGLILLSGTVYGQTVSRGRKVPAIESSAYWDSHDVAVATITSVTPYVATPPGVFNYGQPESVRVKPVMCFTPGQWGQELELSTQNTWFAPSGELPVMSKGQHVLLLRSTQDKQTPMDAISIEDKGPRRLPFLGNEPDGDIEQSAIVKACRAIEAMRKMPAAIDAFHAGLASGQPLAIRYAINLVTKEAKPADVARLVPDLEKLRQDDNVDTEARISASEAINTLLKRDANTSDDWKWTMSAMEQSHNLDKNGPTYLALRLLNFPERRAETIDFLIRMANDPKQQLPVRVACTDLLHQPLYYTASNPSEPLSEKVFIAFQNLLKDKNPDIRKSAAMGLRVKVGSAKLSRASPQAVASLAHKAAIGLRDAIEKETDAETRQLLELHLKVVEDAEQSAKASATGT